MHKPDEKYEADVKRQNELVRRWKVEIFQIEIVNLTSEIIDPFLQIIIGGDYFVGLTYNLIALGRTEEALGRLDTILGVGTTRDNLSDRCFEAGRAERKRPILHDQDQYRDEGVVLSNNAIAFTFRVVELRGHKRIVLE